jgi:hypothetical protein
MSKAGIRIWSEHGQHLFGISIHHSTLIVREVASIPVGDTMREHRV